MKNRVASSPGFRGLVALALTLCLTVVAWSQSPETRPNIIFIVADDLGYGDLSSYGRKDCETPAIDRLASQGIRFSQAYAGAPVCTPSRVSFMTGRYPARIAVGLWEPLTASPVDRLIGLPSEHPTVSSLMKKGGYATALVGKWHLGSRPEHHPNRHGFDEFFGTIEGASDYVSHVDLDGEPDLFHNESAVSRDGYLTDLLTEEAVSFITRPRTQPFFLSLQYTAPHWPWQSPGDAPYSLPQDTATATGTDAPRRDPAAAWIDGGSPDTYAAMMKRLDDGIGAIVAALEKHGLRENTLIIFTSDNGGEKFSRMDPFSGRKMQLREGGVRVPAMMCWPGVLPAGRETNQLVITMDWTATILAAAHVNPAVGYDLDGINILPICRGEKPTVPRTFGWRTFQRIQHQALRHGDWKYLHDGKTDHLFNVTDDPAEQRDLKDKQPERFEEVRSLYRRWESQMLAPISLQGRPVTS